MSTLLPKKDFSRFKPLMGISNLNEMQIRSYAWFLKDGLRELLKEASPIYDHTGKELELTFDNYSFGEPKYDEVTSRYKDATYEAPLHITVSLKDKRSNRKETQEIYFGDFPIMTTRGTFIINGVERVVVSQLVRSAGVYFTAGSWHGTRLFGAKVIPNRGSWLEFETEIDGSIHVKIDRHRKVAVTDLMRVFGVADEEMRTLFRDVDTGTTSYIEATLKKDSARDLNES
ncbi:MAG: hypothetical protein ACRD3W_18020, partial [Terriglobales bacterium]